MPPVQTSAYFPSLDKCLAGEHRSISWKSAYRAFCDQDAVADNATLEAFLTDPESTNFLSNAIDPYLPPGPKTKSDFETKTAPIQVSQSTSGDYDLEELKKDALWLSDKVELEQLVALRVVIVEWQQRAEDQLLAGVDTNGDSGIVATKDLNASALGASTLSFTKSVNETIKPVLDFKDEEIRRERQLQLYLEEKSYILKLSTELVNRVAVQESRATTGRNWIDGLADKIVLNQCCTNDATTHETFCASTIEIIDSLVLKASDNSRWPEAFKAEEAKQVLFVAATFTDITTALRLLLANLHMLQNVPRPDTVTKWFKLMGRENFFQPAIPSLALPNVETLQSLASIISVTILQVTSTLNLIQELSRSVQYPRIGAHSAYFQNDACAKEVNLILYNAAQSDITLAAPAIYGWSMITGLLRDAADTLQEIREERRTQLEDESSDGEVPTRRRASRRDSWDELTAMEKQYLQLQDFELDAEARDNPPAFFLRASANQMRVFSIITQLSVVVTGSFGSALQEATSFIGRITLLELVREGMPLVSYDDEVLEAVLSLLTPDVHGRSQTFDSSLAKRLLSRDDGLRKTVLDEALARYPFELSPLLRLLPALTSAPSQRSVGPPDLVQMLESLARLTVMMPEHFRDYTLENEDENNNSMMLTQTFPMFVSKQARSYYGTNFIGRAALTMGTGEDGESNVLAIPSGSAGTIVREDPKPFVIKFEHPHSGLEYLGLLLSTILPNSELLTAPVENLLDRSTAAEIIRLINALLKACMRQHQGVEEARFVLGRLCSTLPADRDIISVIADVFEMELLAHLDQSIQVGSLELLVACAKFFDTLTKISPERVWSTLGRSSLLGLAGGANALAAVVGGTEVPSGRFRFLGACVKMYTHLIDDAVAGLVKRKAKINRTTNRFDSPMSYEDATPERTMSTVLTAYQTVMIDAWQSLGEWRFSVGSEKSEITCLVLAAFERLLKSTHGVDGKEGASKGIAALLIPAATTLLDSFASGNTTTLQTFEEVYNTGLSVDDVGLTLQDRQSSISQVNAASSFLTTLIRTTLMLHGGQKRTYSLSTALLKFVPTFAALFSMDHSLKQNLSTLLGELVQVLNNESLNTDPPPLIAKLSTEAAKAWLSVISQLDQPLQDIPVECRIWDFLSAAMKSRQKWFAIYLLTGRLPKEQLKDHSAAKKRSLFAYALDQLSNISTLAPERGMAMLKFVASAQGAWAWSTNEVRSHPEFLKNTLEWLSNLQAPSRSPNLAEELIVASEHQMAARMCDILAVNLHASLEIGDETVLKLLVPKLAFLRQHAASVDAYNKSLHPRLGENFASKFEGCDVADFKRTAANSAPLGSDFFYDLDLANRVLGHEFAWRGMGLNGRPQGFAEEFARANVNLSLVEAQKALLRSWRVLATTLCEFIDENPTLQSELAKTAERCLSANAAIKLEISGMDEVLRIRAGMAFVLVSKLVAMKSEDKAMEGLLSAAWDLVRSSPADFDVATVADDLRYYRTSLQILYLSIQPHVYMNSDSRPSSNTNREASATDETKLEYLDPAVAAILAEVVAKVVVRGFRALCGNLHNSIDLATPTDFALLTAMLKALLSVRGIESVYPQITDTVTSSSIVRGALSLYSWADQLAEVTDQDPVYGEVSIMFLLSLSAVRPVAEHMALEGVLVQLSSANLSNHFRKPGGKGPFDEPRRMFSIWTSGFLPLSLNLLDAVGPPLAADISAFLNSFPEQIRRAETALENHDPSPRHPHAGAITLGLVSEAHDLCLLGLILESDINRGAAEGINAADVPSLQFDHRKVGADAAGLMRQKMSLAARIVPVGPMEERWRGESVGGASDNMLQAKVVGTVVEMVGWLGEE